MIISSYLVIEHGCLLQISQPSANHKKIIWMDCGIHAREWIAPAFCQWFVKEVSVLSFLIMVNCPTKYLSNLSYLESTVCVFQRVLSEFSNSRTPTFSPAEGAWNGLFRGSVV